MRVDRVVVAAASVVGATGAPAVRAGVAGWGRARVVVASRELCRRDVAAAPVRLTVGSAVTLGVTGVVLGAPVTTGASAASTDRWSGLRRDADHAVVPAMTTTARTPNPAHGAIRRTQLCEGAAGAAVTTGRCVVGRSSIRTTVVGDSSDGGSMGLATWLHRSRGPGYYTDSVTGPAQQALCTTRTA